MWLVENSGSIRIHFLEMPDKYAPIDLHITPVSHYLFSWRMYGCGI